MAQLYERPVLLPTSPADHPPRPRWLDAAEYPFESRYAALPNGLMHFVDEGQGEPIVFVHGTPTWSFEWRNLIRGLRGSYRCVAPDHLGFGLSAKPRDFGGHPRDHAANLDALISHLNLRHVTLVLHDFGGPIGLGYAAANPGNVRRIVVMNSWCWPLNDDPHFAAPAKVLGGTLGWFVYVLLNLAPVLLLPKVMGRPLAMPRAIHQHYIQPFATMSKRRSLWQMAKHLLGAAEWYATLWERRAVWGEKPLQIMWGLKDPLFRQSELQRWIEAVPKARVQTWPEVGHLPAEELGADLVAPLLEFLRAG